MIASRKKALRFAQVSGVVSVVAMAMVCVPAAHASNEVKVELNSGDWNWVPPVGTFKTGTGRDLGNVVETGACAGLPGSEKTANRGPVQICNFTNPSSPALDVGWSTIYLPSTMATSPSGIQHEVSRYTGYAVSPNVGGMRLSDQQRSERGKIDTDATLIKKSGVYHWTITLPQAALDDLERKDAAKVSAVQMEMTELASASGSPACQQVNLDDGETFTGTAADDCANITVAPNADVTVTMLGGSDDVALTVPAGSSADVFLGAGDDVLKTSGSGDVSVKAGAGDDTVVLGGGDDAVKAGPGTDVVVGGPGMDSIAGDAETVAQGNIKGAVG